MRTKLSLTLVCAVAVTLGTLPAVPAGAQIIPPLPIFPTDTPVPAATDTPTPAPTPTVNGAPTSTPITGANPIVTENQQPGTDQWLLPTTGFQLADDTVNQIKGYASATSANKGEALSFFVTVTPVQTFTIAVHRLGWYGGIGGRQMLQTAPISGMTQGPCPTVDTATMLMACSWTSSYTLAVPSTWTDGVYLAVLSSAQGYQNYVPFVVRDDARQASFLYQQPVNTYQAYNNWGGKSLYTFNSNGSSRAYKVSFDRPYAADGSADYFGWEVYTVQWLEQQGYDVTYNTDVDAQVNPSRLRSVKGVLIPGHSEYWSKGMYDAAQVARDGGVSLGFLGSNDVYWQIRYEASSAGAANRVVVCYKTNESPSPVDPINASSPSLTTTQWRETPVNRPEQTLLGVQFTSQTGSGWDSTVTYVVTNSSNWVYANTGFSDGSGVPRLTGYEADRQFIQYPLPASQPGTAALLANSPYNSVGNGADRHNASIYQAPSGAWVFASGSQAWAWGLTRSGYTNAGIQQATRNILSRFNVAGPVQPTPAPTSTATPTPTATSTPTPVSGAATATPQPSGSSAYRGAVMADTPLAYWRLGEASGTAAADQLTIRNGTYMNSPALGQPGALFNDPATSVGFNGTSQYIQAPADAALNQPRFSVELWARPTGGAGTYHGLIASRTYPQGWAVYLAADGTWEFWVNSGSGMLSVNGGAATLNAWSHLVGTFDGTTASLYVNGVAVGSGAGTTYTGQSTNPLEIGQSEAGDNFYFPGQLEEAAVYGTALSLTQVQRHYSVGRTGR